MSTIAIPQAEQRLDALRRGRQVRTARADLRRHLETLHPVESARQAAAMLDEIPSELTTMTASQFLTSVHRLGDSTAGRILARHHISTIRQLGQLTDRQRQLLTVDLYRHGRYSPRPEIEGTR